MKKVFFICAVAIAMLALSGTAAKAQRVLDPHVGYGVLTLNYTPVSMNSSAFMLYSSGYFNEVTVTCNGASIQVGVGARPSGWGSSFCSQITFTGSCPGGLFLLGSSNMTCDNAFTLYDTGTNYVATTLVFRSPVFSPGAKVVVTSYDGFDNVSQTVTLN